jgi:hypothetical protein
MNINEILDDWEILCEVEEAIEEALRGGSNLKTDGGYQILMIDKSGERDLYPDPVAYGVDAPKLAELKGLIAIYQGARNLVIEGPIYSEESWDDMLEGDEPEVIPTGYWWSVEVFIDPGVHSADEYHAKFSQEPAGV